MADFGASHPPEPTAPVDPNNEEISALVTCRRHLQDKLKREEMQNEHAKPPYIADLIKRRIRNLKSQIESVEKQMAAVVHSSPFLKRAVAALDEVKGVGQLTAMWLLASMPELSTLNCK